MKFNRMRWQEIADRLPQNQKLWGVEIGVWTAKTSQYLLDNFPLLTLYMVDAWTVAENIPSFKASGAKMATYPQSAYDDAYSTAKQINSRYPGRSHILRMTSEQAALLFEDNFFDFIFFDGDHSENGLNSDFNAWIPKIKPGGLISGHDLNPDPSKGFRGVRKAVYDRFTEQEVSLGDDHTYFIIKK